MRRRQSSIAALMTLVLGSAVVAAVLRDRDNREIVREMILGSLMFVTWAGLMYFGFRCTSGISRLCHRIRPQKRWSRPGSLTNKPSSPIGD